MAGQRIVWSVEASKQRAKILRYWKSKTGGSVYPRKIRARIKLVQNTILSNPEIYKSSEFPHIREATMGEFSLYYRVDKGLIIVLAFWDNRQDPDKLDSLLSDSV